MSPASFEFALLAGTVSLAVWVLVRFPALAPKTLGGVALRVGVAVASLAATAPALGALRTVTTRLAALLLVALPSGVMITLAAAWLLLWAVRTSRS